MTRPRSAAGDRNQVSRRQMNLDILLGILGFLAASAFFTALSDELHGHNAVRPALILLMLVILIFLVMKLRRLK